MSSILKLVLLAVGIFFVVSIAFAFIKSLVVWAVGLLVLVVVVKYAYDKMS